MAGKRMGSWLSPITSGLITAESLRLTAPKLIDGEIFWVEGRPAEQGRQVICRWHADAISRAQGKINDVIPGGDWNATTRVHEYGGGDYLVHQGHVYFSNLKDQRLYKQPVTGDGTPVPLTLENSNCRFADACVDTMRNRLICIMEDHSAGGEPVNSIVAVSLDTDSDPTPPRLLQGGADFFAAPRLSPDGSQLAWVQWDHPAMPWDSTLVKAASVSSEGLLTDVHVVAGGAGESCGQPRWSPTEDTVEGPKERRTESTEYAGPDWQLGQRSYAFMDSHDTILASRPCPESKVSQLEVITGDNKMWSTFDCKSPLGREYTSFSHISVGQMGDGQAVAALVGSANQPATVAFAMLPNKASGSGDPALTWVELRQATQMTVDIGYLSTPQAIEYPSEAGRTAHMLYYPPKNKDYPSESWSEPPPLLVKTHGGPTSACSSTFNAGIQFWTSRGWAVADINYGGSTGYGREYRDRLKGLWGVVDVEDVCAAAQHLVSQKKADPARLCIDGGSAGGYTVLACLAYKNVFKAGASLYGIGDLEVLAGDTHKFESRYLDSLVGRYPEDAALYKARSPINAVDQLDCPVVLFQGLEDKVVPPNQAQSMFDALKAKGIPTSLCMFEGERHGFRQAANIRRCLDGELYFFLRVFGEECSMPEGVEPIEVVNLKDGAPLAEL